MPRKPLPDDIEAYNALVGVVNARDAVIAQAVDERNRAAKAAEVLYPTNAFRPVKLVKVAKPRRSR